MGLFTEGGMMHTACLMYHDVFTERPLSKFSVSYDNFADQVSWLKDNGYQSADLYADRRKAENKRTIVISFDDGHKSDLRAGEILAKAGLSGVFYLIKDAACKHWKGYLSEQEIKDLAGMGHMIGVHGLDHGWWTHKEEEQLVAEIRETKDWIENMVGRKVITCSAPGGFINNRVFRFLSQRFIDLAYIRNSNPWYNDLRPGCPVNSAPITCSTTINEFQQIVNCNYMYYALRASIYWAKRIVKGVKYGY